SSFTALNTKNLTLPILWMELLKPCRKQCPGGIAQRLDRQRDAAAVLKVMVHCPAFVRLRVPGPTCVTCAQVLARLEFTVPVPERVLRWIAELANGQPNTFAQLDVELHGSQPILV